MSVPPRKYPVVLMFGCPGSGKGTQGVVIGAMPNIVHLAMGDIFRALDQTCEIGKEFASYAAKGELVPDDLTVRVFLHQVDARIAAQEIDPDYHTLILDGIPRTVNQVELLAAVVDVKRVVHLTMDDRDALITRLASRAVKTNRPDDAHHGVIANRIEVYERETFPVLAQYSHELIFEVNADQPPLAVLRDVAEALRGVISPRI